MTRYELQHIQDFLIDHIQTLEFPGTETTLRYIGTNVVDELMKLDFEENDYGAIKVSQDYTMDDIITILSDGLAMENAFSAVDYDKNEYYRAKEKLIEEGFDKDSIVFEAVQTKMLMMGYSLKLKESEEDVWHELTLEKLIKGLDMSVAEMMDSYHATKLRATIIFFEEGDFYSYEGAIQNAIFGRIVYA